MESRSFENLDTILPSGVVSKKLIGLCNSLTSKDLKIFLETYIENRRKDKYLSRYNNPPDRLNPA